LQPLLQFSIIKVPQHKVITPSKKFRSGLTYHNKR
jgi:hypothetical protein